MNKLNPYFEVEGKRYEIVRTPYLECEYDKITSESSLTAEEERAYSTYMKLQSDYEELVEKFNNVKEDYFANVTNKGKKEQYKAFEELVNEKYNEIVEFGVKHKDFSLNRIKDVSYANGKRILILGLCEQYKVSEKEAENIWSKFEEHLGKQTAFEWIMFMVNSLFDNESEEDDPFLKQAKAKAQQRMEQRKGLTKIKR